MDVAIATDPSTIEDIADEWMTLWGSDPAATPFHTPDHARAEWDTELGADRSFLSVQMRRGGALVGLANCSIEPDGVLRFLGNANVTDYLGPLSALADRTAVADAFVDAVEQVAGWTTADLLGIAEDSGWLEPLTKAAGSRGLSTETAKLDVCPRIALSGDFDAYLADLSSKLRHELRRKERRLHRETGGYTVRLSDAATLEADLETFYEMHRRSEGPKGHFLYEEMAALFSAIARAFLARGWLRLSWLEVDGRPWAGVFSFAARGVWSVYNSAFDHEKRDLGPGMVLMGETIRLAANEGATCFDLLRGDEPYKYRFGAVDVPVMRLTLGREDPVGVPALQGIAADTTEEG